jgi:hypothetical protein
MPINTERKEGTMTALTRMAVMLRIYTDDLRERREQGRPDGRLGPRDPRRHRHRRRRRGFVSGWFADRMAEIVDPF